jgi:hypothetical protein
MTDEPDEPTAPNPVPSGVEGQRSFALDSPEAYAVLCPRQDQPWIANGALPREPRARDRHVIVEWRRTDPCSR